MYSYILPQIFRAPNIPPAFSILLHCNEGCSDIFLVSSTFQIKREKSPQAMTIISYHLCVSCNFLWLDATSQYSNSSKVQHVNSFWNSIFTHFRGTCFHYIYFVKFIYYCCSSVIEMWKESLVVYKRICTNGVPCLHFCCHASPLSSLLISARTFLKNFV